MIKNKVIHEVSKDWLSLDKITEIINDKTKLGLSELSKMAIQKCRLFLDNKLNSMNRPVYGINTGFGSLCNVRISEEAIVQLQHNLVLSHAAGVGDEVPVSIVRLMLLLKIKNFSLGYSGVRLVLVERLLDFYNLDILPVIYQQGSLGASGDLAPLAHLALPLIGEGEVRYEEKRQTSAEVMTSLGLSALALQSKEGLAMLNGTQFSTAYGTWCLIEAKRLFSLANLTAALSIDAFDCRLEPFNSLLHRVRCHEGQLIVAKEILELLKDSEIAHQVKQSVQDPYAFRCIPQVHGATFAAIKHASEVFENEINSVTDNPTVFPDENLILSGGNFHGQPIAMVLDYLAIALAELGSISERRIYQLISGKRQLPQFLTPDPGLHSGMMIAQYTAASIVSQNKQLCTPASVDSIVSCNGQEDHVSMAANAATKLYQVVQNTERLLAIEWMIATQALSFKQPLLSSSNIEEVVKKYRSSVPVLKEDRILSNDIFKTVAFLRKND